MNRARCQITALVALGLAMTAVNAAAQISVEAPFSEDYDVINLGSPPGVPGPHGGILILQDDPDTLLIGGGANGASGKLYSIGLVRDEGSNHVIGFTAPAELFADAAYHDGGLALGPEETLFFSRWSLNEVGQITTGSLATDAIIHLDDLGASSSTGGLNFVPEGLPGAGGFKVGIYSTGDWYSVNLVAAGDGTYSATAATLEANISGGPEGFLYIQSQTKSVLNSYNLVVCEYFDDTVVLYEIDGDGNPIPETRAPFVNFTNAEGVTIDPVTGDFLFSSYAAGDLLIVVGEGPLPDPLPLPTPTPGPTPTPEGLFLAQPFDGAYEIISLGTVPGLPTNYGGITFLDGDPDTLLIGGNANRSNGKLYSLSLERDPGTDHIIGYAAPASEFSGAPHNDGGLAYGPGGVLFFSRYPLNEFGQIPPGGIMPSKIIGLSDLGLSPSTGGLNFVPPGFPGAGRLKVGSYNAGHWLNINLIADGSGTFDVDLSAPPTVEATLPGGPEGFAYVAPGTTLFPAGGSMVLSEWWADRVSIYELDAEGNPIPLSRTLFISGLDGAEGAAVDPVTGDFLFSTWGGDHQIIVVGEGDLPEPLPSPTPTPIPPDIFFAAPFSEEYNALDLGSVHGVPHPYGGVTFLAGDPDTLLIGGRANRSDGKIYSIGLERDSVTNHITGYSGEATVFADASYIDGGLAYGPDAVLFHTRYPKNEIAQIKPGSTGPDKETELSPLGVTPSTGGLTVVPATLPGAGQIKIGSWNSGKFYTVSATSGTPLITPDGSGTFDIGFSAHETTIQGGPEGFTYVAAGVDPFPPAGALVVCEYSAQGVSVYELDAEGNPIPSTRSQFVNSLEGAEGVAIDPLTGDFIFSTYTGGNRVIVAGVFDLPTPRKSSGSSSTSFKTEISSTLSGGGERNWTGGNFAGLGGIFDGGSGGDLTGLCMTVDGPTAEGIVWFSEEDYITLRDNTVYRLRIHASTDQTDPGAIPLWDVSYDNFHTLDTDPPSAFINFGGSEFFLDVAGGSSGIGRKQGRSEYEFWMAPNALSSAAWRSAAGGINDPANQAMTGMRIVLRVLDTNPALLFENDSGTICIQDIQIDSIDADELNGITIYDPPISEQTHAWYGFSFTQQGGTIGAVTKTARLRLSPDGDVDGDMFGPQIAAETSNELKYFPLKWEADTLYCLEADIRQETSETDPVNVITLGLDVPTVETIISHWSTRSAPGAPLDRAASPRLTSATYRAYWFSHNTTIADPIALPDVDRFRPFLQFFNRADLGGVDPSGGDALVVESLRVLEIRMPQ